MTAVPNTDGGLPDAIAFRAAADGLSTLLQRFSVRAGVFHTGRICGLQAFDADLERGHVHLVLDGHATLSGGVDGEVKIRQPTLVYLPRPDAHRLVADKHEGAEVVCATLRFEGDGHHPITWALPPVVVAPLAEMPGAAAWQEMLRSEMFADRCGRQAALDRLCELLMIGVLRRLLASGRLGAGTLAALADPKLSKALLAFHADIARPWTLLDMARAAGMSRPRFAHAFHDLVGQAPGHYLTALRVATAQRGLSAGRSVEHVAADVGYSSASALTRAFARVVGEAPRQWRKRRDAES